MKNINELLFKEKDTAKFIGKFTDFIKKRCEKAGDSYDLSSTTELTFSLDEFENMPDDLKERFASIQTIGCLRLDKQYIAMFLVRANKDLNERSCRGKQFNFAKKILLNTPGKINNWFHKKYINFASGLFLFLSQDCQSYRLSLVECKKDQNQFKRYTFFVSSNQSNRTFCNRIGSGKKWETFADLKEAFSVEKLSDDFFNAYKEYYQKFIDSAVIVDDDSKKIFADTGDKDKALRDYVKKMMGRLVFLQFLQKKGWLGVPEGAEWGNGDKEYLKNLFENSSDKDNFLEAVLEKLFFNTLNQNRGDDAIADAVLAVNGSKVRIPYLNGGLFEEDKLDKAKVKFPSECFAGLFDTFERYNFTIDENDPDDKEVGVDPEMLGRIFENLLEDNKDKGAFYTPKEIVQYMCEESLIAYLGDTEENRKLVKEFDASGITNAPELLEKLEDVKICDPAIGSGAFPMGMLNILYRIRMKLENLDDTAENIVRIKKEIIQKNIYGVDIEAGAVDIARLRFWLSIIVDEDEKKKPIPLPNLDYKIMQGNSLLEQYNGVDLKLDLRATDKKGKKINTQVVERQMYFAWDDEIQAIEDLKKATDDFFEPEEGADKNKLRNGIDAAVKNYIKTKCGNDPSVNAEVDSMDLNNKPFFLWHLYFADIFVQKGGFDIVIGNPPYLKEGRISKTLFAQYKNNPYYEGKMDLWQIFACQGIDMLNPAGHLCFIATNNWVTNSGAKKMRNKIISDAQIKQMIDFGTYMIFKDSASIQTMIMLFGKNAKINNYAFDWRFLNAGATEGDMNDLLRYANNQFSVYKKPIINRRSLKNKLLTFSGADDLLSTIVNKGILHFNDKEIAQGIVFPQDFLNKKGRDFLQNYSIGDGIFGLSQSELDNFDLDENEKELIKPYFTTEQIGHYYTSTRNRQWMIYTDSRFKQANSMDKYPTLKTHLDKFLPIFTSDNKPYGLHRSREQHFFCGEKIISLRKCADRPLFSYSDFDCYVTQTFFIVQTSRWNMKFLTGLLNSKLIAYWLRHKGKMQGNNYQVDKEPLLGIPLVKPSANDQKQLADLVDKIRQQKEQNIDADISELEKAIDDIVYKLYGLTDKEISIIDESLKKPVAAEGKKKRGKKAAAVPAEPVINDDNDEGDGDF